MANTFFKLLAELFKTFSRALSFLLNPQKLGQVFKKLTWNFQRLGLMCSAESFDQRTQEFLIIWSVKSSLHISNKNPELLTKLQRAASILKFSMQFKSLPLFLSFFLFQILITKSRFQYFTYVANATNLDVTSPVP